MEPATTDNQLRIPWRSQRTLDDLFAEWLQSDIGRAIYVEAASRALQLRARGVVRYGIGAICESIRYDWTLAGRLGVDADGFKVNNNHRSRLARRLMAEHPDLVGMFEVRRLST